MDKAIERHFRENYREFYKLSLRKLKDHHHAEDAVQETYLNALKYRDTYNEDADLSKWLGGILRNTLRRAYNDIQNGGVTMEVDPHLFPVDPFPRDPEHLVNLKELIRISPLTAEEREAMTLWVIKGYTPEDCEVLTGLSRAQVYRVWRKMKSNVVEVVL